MFRILSFLLLINIVNATTGYYRFSSCEDFLNEESCLDADVCKWCNSSNVDYKCKQVAPCEIQKDTCSYNENFNFKLECNIISTLFFLFMTIGYFVSMVIIYGTTKQLLIYENVSDKTIGSINTIILLITTAPLVITLLFKPIVFYFMFLSYMIAAAFIYLCVQVKVRRNKQYETLEQLP